MKKKLSWYPEAKIQPAVTEIFILDTYTPEGTPDAEYNSDVDATGAIKVYLEGTTVTIAGNGSGKISLNSDSRGVFAKFCGVESIEGLELLDGSLVTNLGGAFNFCHRLKEVNISAWELPNVTALAGMFADCSKLERVYLPKDYCRFAGWKTYHDSYQYTHGR